MVETGHLPLTFDGNSEPVEFIKPNLFDVAGFADRGVRGQVRKHELRWGITSCMKSSDGAMTATATSTFLSL